MDDAAVAKLVEHCRTSLGPPSEWRADAGLPDALALAVLDAFWSPDGLSDRGTTDEVLGLYREMREADWGEPDTDGTAEFLAQFEILGGPAYFAEQLKKREPDASSRKAVLNSGGALEACELLHGADLTTAEAVRSAPGSAIRELERAWKRIAGQRSGETFNRVLLLVGCPSIAPDRRLVALVNDVVGAELTPEDVAETLGAAANTLGVAPQALATRIRGSAGSHVDEA